MVSTDSHTNINSEPINTMSASACAHRLVVGCSCNNIAQEGKTLCKSCEDNNCGYNN
jgi:hypothetical protein